MQHYVLRCKHCNAEYVYGGNDKATHEYCQECGDVIQQALARIPKKFEARPMEINEPRLFPLFDKIRVEEAAKLDSLTWPTCFGLLSPGGDYDWIEVIVHNGKKFLVRRYDEEPDKKDISVYMEYDLAAQKFTDKPWRYTKNDSYCVYYNSMKPLLEQPMIPQLEMPKPQGSLFFAEFLGTNPDTDNPVVPKAHKLKRNSWSSTGFGIRTMVNNGSLLAKDTAAIESLVDFLDYTYTTEEYEDEGVRTIIGIECA